LAKIFNYQNYIDWLLKLNPSLAVNIAKFHV